MKTLKFMLLLVLGMMVFGCNPGENQFNGTYVNQASSEFSVANDTLSVEHVSGLDYLIHRKTGFRLIDESGKRGKLLLETEEWKAVYDEGSVSMTENRKGRVISFDLDKGLLILENSKYQRIN